MHILDEFSLDNHFRLHILQLNSEFGSFFISEQRKKNDKGLVLGSNATCTDSTTLSDSTLQFQTNIFFSLFKLFSALVGVISTVKHLDYFLIRQE
jgi:hypothetical protein